RAAAGGHEARRSAGLDGPAHGQRLSTRAMTGQGCRAWPLRPRAGAGWEGSRRLARSPALPRARDDPRQRLSQGGGGTPPMRNWLRTNSSGTIHLSSISAPEEFRMTITLDQLAEALQSLFTTDADQAAKDSGMIRRKRKLTGAAFVQALVFHWLEN